MEFTVKNFAGKLEKYYIDLKTGTAQKVESKEEKCMHYIVYNK